MCALLFTSHRKRSNDPEKVFNRVFKKGVRLSLGRRTDLPTLSRGNVSVTLESRKVTHLAQLTNRTLRDPNASPYPPGSPKRFKSRARKNKDVPVIIANFAGRDFMLDGNRRVQYLGAIGQEFTQAYVCNVQ